MECNIILPMKVSELGEFGLIDVLTEIVSRSPIDPQIVIGLGDDAAAWRTGDGVSLATTDTMVEGVHFTRGSTWSEIGWKAVASNLSDIAAMAGTPTAALVTIGLPRDFKPERIEAIYAGMNALA
ncbi:MAG: AIR synthase related protein, partial [Chloroflexi bacterium]|nr:AIR synthase related protein [Chloroflexota bacterium]